MPSTASSGKDTFAPFAVKTGKESASESPKETFAKRNFGSTVPPPPSGFKESASATPPGKTSFAPFGGGNAPKADLTSSTPPKQSYSPFSQSKSGSSTPPSFATGNDPASDAARSSSNTDSYLSGKSGKDSASLAGRKSFMPFDPAKAKTAQAAPSGEKKPFVPFQKSDQSTSSSSPTTSFTPVSDSSASPTASTAPETSNTATNKPASVESYLASMSGTSSTSPPTKTSYSPFGSAKGSSKSTASSNYSPFGQWTPGSSTPTKPSSEVAKETTQSAKPSSPRGSYFTSTETVPPELLDGRKSFMPFDKSKSGAKPEPPTEKKPYQPFDASKLSEKPDAFPDAPKKDEDKESKSAWSSLKNAFANIGGNSKSDESSRPPLEATEQEETSNTATPSKPSLESVSGASSNPGATTKSYSPFGSISKPEASSQKRSLSPFFWTPGSANPSSDSSSSDTGKTADVGTQLGDSYLQSVSSTDLSGKDTFAPFAVQTGESSSVSPKEAFSQRNSVPPPPPFFVDSTGSNSVRLDAGKNAESGPASTQSYLEGMSTSNAAADMVKSSYAPFGQAPAASSSPKQNYSPFGWSPGSSAPASSVSENGESSSVSPKEAFSQRNSVPPPPPSDTGKTADAGTHLGDSYLQSVSSTDLSGKDTFAPFAVQTGESSSVSPKEAFSQRNSVPPPPPPPFPVEATGSNSVRLDAGKDVESGPTSTQSYLEGMSTSNAAADMVKTSYAPFGQAPAASSSPEQNYSPFGWSPGSSTPASSVSENVAPGNTSSNQSMPSSDTSYLTSTFSADPLEATKAGGTSASPANRYVANAPNPEASTPRKGFSPFAEWLKSEAPRAEESNSNVAREGQYMDEVRTPTGSYPNNNWFDGSPSLRTQEPAQPASNEERQGEYIDQVQTQPNSNVARQGQYMDEVRTPTGSYPNNNWFDGSPSVRTQEPAQPAINEERQGEFIDQVQTQPVSIDPNNDWYQTSPSQPNVDTDTRSGGRSSYFESQPLGNWFDKNKGAGSALDQDWKWNNN
jgi:hypothetical protein